MPQRSAAPADVKPFDAEATALANRVNRWPSAGTRASALPPRAAQAQRFLAERGWKPGSRRARTGNGHGNLSTSGSPASAPGLQAQQSATATWQPLGPTAVITPNFGLVTGRVSALALDPSDATGNRLYLGTTGGGVWVAQNAARPANQPRWCSRRLRTPWRR